MAKTNKKIVEHLHTHEGANAVIIPPIAQLERSVMSCLLWEKEFYEEGKNIVDRICTLVKVCPAEKVADLAIRAKQDMRLRHVPLLLARELARTKEGRAQLKHVIPAVINRVDDITELLAMYFLQKKAPRESAKLPNQIRKHLGACFAKFDEYQLAKWNGGNKSVTLKDAIRITHPKPINAEQGHLWQRLISDELKTPDTWEVELSKNKDKAAAWTRLLAEKKLGGLAMLRNIRNMREADVEAKLIWEGINTIKAGRLLPINFIAAAMHNPQFEPIIEKKFLECFTDKKKLSGKTIILVDISGSMVQNLSGRSDLTRIDVACSLAMIGTELFEELRVFSFSNNVKEIPVRHGFALSDAISSSQSHDGTNLGQAVREMPRDARLIVITDEQSRDSVEQRKGYMINVASAQNGVGYHQWTHIDGWSDRIFDYIIAKESQNQ